MLARTPPPSKAELTDKLVARLPLAGSDTAPPGDQYIVRDTILPGFFVRVGRKSTAWTAQADAIVDGKRKTFRTVLGRTDERKAAAARKAAKDWIIGVQAKSRLPAAKVPKGPTLQEAWAAYRRRLERLERQPGTIVFYEDILRGPLKHWLSTSLRELGDDPAKVARWHERETDARGPYRANGAARTLSAVYRYASKKLDTKLPPCPTLAIELNREGTSKGGMGLDELAAWANQLRTLSNPIRREFHLMTLLTGSRPDALARACWEHVDVKRRTLHFPSPKGGARRAFDIPLSRAMIRSLVRLRRAAHVLYPHSKWIFPAASYEGRLVEWKEDRHALSQWGRDLRKTFRTVAAVLEVPELFSQTLMNHKSSGVHNRYLVSGKLGNALRDAQEEISRAIMGSIGK
jgi:integrase